MSTTTASPTLATRPQFHFTPRRNWMNDPNGLVYVDGLWHLFFQYNPESADWGNMSWGHATSADLQHWDEHPVALLYSDREQIYSGSVVAAPTDTLTAYYTSAYDDGLQKQSRATSRDGGYTWQRDPANPILDRSSHDFRDPKVVRYTAPDGTRHWVMLTVEAVDRQLLIFTSDNLSDWQLRSTFGPIGPEDVVWECPDLVQLSLDDDPTQTVWALLLSTNSAGDEPDPEGSNMHYIVGDFDGATFTSPAQDLERLDHGRDFYAAVTFDNAPDDEKVAIGWMSNWRYAHAVPTTPWRGAMSLPRTLSARTTGERVQLVQSPPAFVTDALTTTPPVTTAIGPNAQHLTITGHTLLALDWEPATIGALRLELRGATESVVTVQHDTETSELHITRSGPAIDAVHPDFAWTSVTPFLPSRVQRLLLSLDGPLAEAFLGDGEATTSNLVLLGEGPIDLSLTSASPGELQMKIIEVASPQR